MTTVEMSRLRSARDRTNRWSSRLTLGNALRRVLLSSLQGAAITSIRIETVLHEFSRLAGVRKAPPPRYAWHPRKRGRTAKQIALRMEGEGP